MKKLLLLTISALFITANLIDNVSVYADDIVDYGDQTIFQKDNRTAYLERYGEYFDIYKYAVDYSSGDKVYSYLLADKDDVKKIPLDDKYTFMQLTKLAANEYYFIIKPDKYEEYKQKSEDDRKSKPFKVNLVVHNESGEQYFSFSTREAANEKIASLGLKPDEYEIQERWGGGDPTYVVEPQLYEGARVIEYLDDKGTVISSAELKGDLFAYNLVNDAAFVRFVMDKTTDAGNQYSYSDNKQIRIGDINSDGIIDVTDLTELSLFLIGDRELTSDQQLSVDIDTDGSVTLADLARLRQYLSKKIETL